MKDLRGRMRDMRSNGGAARQLPLKDNGYCNVREPRNAFTRQPLAIRNGHRSFSDRSRSGALMLRINSQNLP
jgi:hypothetical protein